MKNVQTNVEKAAKILANFEFEGSKKGIVGIYFHTRSNRDVGTGLAYPNDSDDKFFGWDANKWQEFILAKMKAHADLKLERVIALRIEFSITDSSDAPRYCVEVTNLDHKKSFDRVVFIDYPEADVYLTREESEAMVGVFDVVEFCDKISIMERRRRCTIGTDLPEAML